MIVRAPLSLDWKHLRDWYIAALRRKIQIEPDDVPEDERRGAFVAVRK